MPINNDFELLVSRNRLAEFKAAHDQIVAALGSDALLVVITLQAIDSMIKDLEGQIKEYQFRDAVAPDQ